MKRSFATMAELPVEERLAKMAMNNTRSIPFPPLSYNTGESFEVIVGVRGHKYTLCKGLTCFVSGYFRAALKKDTFREGRENIVVLPTEMIKTFEHFITWMNGLATLQPVIVTTDTMFDYIQLYAFADRRDVPLLENAIIDSVFHSFKNKSLVLKVTHLRSACFWLREGCGLRRFIIRLMLGYMPTITFHRWKDSGELACQEGLLMDVSGQLASLMAGGRACLCDFHTHLDVANCGKLAALNLPVLHLGERKAQHNLKVLVDGSTITANSEEAKAVLRSMRLSEGADP